MARAPAMPGLGGSDTGLRGVVLPGFGGSTVTTPSAPHPYIFRACGPLWRRPAVHPLGSSIGQVWRSMLADTSQTHVRMRP